jgi:ABC-type phosphate transport system substrate-binding protein
MLKTPTRRLAPVLAAVFAAGLAGASTASADFSIAACTGEPVIARGASFQNSAFTGWQTSFATSAVCGATAPLVTLQASGSGAGRQALGVKGGTNTFQDRDVSIRFAASDEPLTATDRQQIEKGPIDANGVDVTTADDNPVHLIPVAIGAVAVIVLLPTGCAYAPARPRPTPGAS